MITAIFIPSPPSKFKDVRLDAQAEHSGAGIKSRSNHSLTAQTFGGGRAGGRALIPKNAFG
jgi:hypothetical protein